MSFLDKILHRQPKDTVSVSVKANGEALEVLEQIKDDLGLATNGDVALFGLRLAATFAEAQRKDWTLTVKEKGRNLGTLEQEATEVVIEKVAPKAPKTKPAAAPAVTA